MAALLRAWKRVIAEQLFFKKKQGFGERQQYHSHFSLILISN